MLKDIRLSEISIEVISKDIKNTHLSVYPPDGRVVLVTPKKTSFEVAHAYAVSKIKWIRKQQAKFRKQAREFPRKFIDRESHQVWGDYYLMKVNYEKKKSNVILNNKEIILTVRPRSNQKKRSQIIESWQKSLLYEYVDSLIKKWEKKLNVKVKRHFIRKMKTRWGSCNKSLGHIRLNTELVKKPKELVEYVVVHEMTHLIETRHNNRFIKILDKHCPFWRDHRSELNQLPLSAKFFKKN